MGNDVETIISTAHPALVSVDVILLGSSFKFRLLVLDLAFDLGEKISNS